MKSDPFSILDIIAGSGSGGAIILVGLVVLILIVMKMKRFIIFTSEYNGS